jgi:hypothetical protein
MEIKCLKNDCCYRNGQTWRHEDLTETMNQSADQRMNELMNEPDSLSDHPFNPPNYRCLTVKFSWPSSQFIQHFRTIEAHQGFQIIHQQFLINTNLTKQELCPFVKLQPSMKSSNRIRHLHTNLKSEMVSIQSTVIHETWILTLYFKLPAVFKTFFLEDGVLSLAGQVFPCVLLPNDKWQRAGCRVAVVWCLWAQKQIPTFEDVQARKVLLCVYKIIYLLWRRKGKMSYGAVVHRPLGVRRYFYFDIII